MNQKFLVDNDIEFIECKTLKQADKVASQMKKEHPLTNVFISKVINTPNGEIIETIAEA